MRTWPLWIGLLGCGSLALLGQREQHREMAAMRAEMAAMAAAAQQEQQPARLLERLIGAPAAPAAPAVQAVPGAGAPPHAAPVPSAEEMAAQLENGFLGERVDAAWATASQRSLRDGVAGIGLEDRSLRSLECRQQSCRLETVHASAGDSRRFLEEALRPGERPLWRGGMYVAAPEDLGDGRVAVVTYLLREPS